MSNAPPATNSENTTSKPVVVYDGECRFCIARVNEFQKLDAHSTIEYMPRQEPACEDRFPSVRNIDLDDGILFIEPNGHIHVAADAVYQIYHTYPSTRKLAWIYQVPVFKQIFQLGYRIVAMNRRRLGQTCKDNVCGLDHNNK
jgi:predicted DCC family thiol-disulfide oxidoreductase YuxK